ncbi:hypothetical protein [Spirillospora sp. CA-128828]|uniref:hypothetical protein n=1 Tax=Spirillospora sp. CA-128828 TaxID=3240033 RepID=UPI003D8E73B8
MRKLGPVPDASSVLIMILGLPADVDILVEGDRDTVEADLEPIGDGFEKAAEKASLKRSASDGSAVLMVHRASRRPLFSGPPSISDGSLKITVRVPQGIGVRGIVRGLVTVSGGYDRNLFTVTSDAETYL